MRRMLVIAGGLLLACALAPSGGEAAPPAAAVPAPPVATTHGLVIPAGHPRIWYDAGRLARARSWARRNLSAPSRNDPLGQALRGLLLDDTASCRAAIDWALASARTIRMSGVSCDACRWSGEAMVLTYDWCHRHLSPDERQAFIGATNAWVDHWRQQQWGGVPMNHNNYYWGYLRNELLWAIASYEDNVAMAERLLDDVFAVRLAGDFYPSARSRMRGGVGVEGSQYGPYVGYYATVPLVTASLLGRDLFAETGWWREAVYALLYATTPAPTAQAGVSPAGHVLFPFSDDEQWLGVSLRTTAGAPVKANFMAAAAMHWHDQPVGQLARHWLETTQARPDAFVRSVDPGGRALDPVQLPLDYFAAGPRYLWARTGWDPSATAVMLQLGEGPGSGHQHVDWGTWQIWRKGRFLSRESVGYGEKIAGYRGEGSISSSAAHAHNGLLIDGDGLRGDPWTPGRTVLRRLESRPGYAYAAVDLTPTATHPQVAHVEREFVFVRSPATLVVLDRIETRKASAVKTFLAHCEGAPRLAGAVATCPAGDQALTLTALSPGATLRSVVEGGKVGQHRIEVDTAPGTALSHMVTVLQLHDAGAPPPPPVLREDGGSLAVELERGVRLSFAKGARSSGGTIAFDGAPAPLRADVQAMEVGDAGPIWR
ncbi:MAG: hypothetical protein HZB56_20540 [Deltaproteobacteria bacterium]|nr:hypothetical protein [Deltaproteobacteria bacterium]